MIPHPRKEKYYRLDHKRIPGCMTLRGLVIIADIGFMNGEVIFRTEQRGNSWFYWKDYNYMYIGDLQ